jgi:iron complex outermembrane receptor protein
VAYNETTLGNVSLIATYRLPGNVTNLPQCVGTQTLGCFNYTPYVVDLSGGANPFSPKVTFDAGVDYGIRLGSNSTLRPRVTFSHTDKQYASVFQNDNYFLMGVRNLWGANLTYERGPWTGQLYGTNLTNLTYVSAYNGNFEYYGAPRQFGIRVTRTF